MDWILIAIALLSGIAAGMLLLHLMGNRDEQMRQLRDSLEQERREHAAYRQQVSEHFTRTAVAVNRMTESYRHVHEELRAGASVLCDNAAAELALAGDEALLIPAPNRATGHAGASDAATRADGPPRDYADGETDPDDETPAREDEAARTDGGANEPDEPDEPDDPSASPAARPSAG